MQGIVTLGIARAVVGLDNHAMRHFIALFLSCWLAAALPAQAQVWEMPPLDKAINYQPKQPLQVFTADGVEIAQFGAERRQFVPIAQIPKLLQDAVIAVEDGRFREHGGIDPMGMARAAVAMLTGGRKQGASTITQQVARNMFLSHRFTAERKAKEIMIALELEKKLSKDRILELYMNEIYLGERAYGFAAAAQTYFGKPMDKLSIAETALLAGVPQNPVYANPVVNLDRALKRQRIVLERMRVTGVINDTQHAAAREEKIVLRSTPVQEVHAEHVAEMARRVVVERFGEAAYARGIRVVTTLRAADQQAAWTALRKGVMAFDRKGPWRGVEDLEELPAKAEGEVLEAAAAQALKDHRDDPMLRAAIVVSASAREVRVQLHSGQQVAITGDALRWVSAGLSPKAKTPLKIERGAVVRVVATGEGAAQKWSFAQWPQADAALAALDPTSGRVRALVGGFDFSRQPFNHVTQAWRQPGSALKPLLYSAALETGVMPETLVDDEPVVMEQPGAKTWAPKNSDGRFDGPLTLRAALAKSKNMVSIRALQHVGLQPARDWLARFGLETQRHPANLTMALGTGSVTPLQMAQAYAVFANGGWRVNPVVVERITDAKGVVLFQAPPPGPFDETQRALPERNVFLMRSMMNDVTRVGTAARAQRELKRNDLFGKTGTTDDAVDAWFAGFQPSLVTAVWLGYDEPKSLGDRESGGGLALPIWIDFMGAALKGVPVAPAPVPPADVLFAGDDWRYVEWAQAGWVRRIGVEGVDFAVPSPPAPSSAPEAPASAPQ
jgi:penicillin-binding protein 1A